MVENSPDLVENSLDLACFCRNWPDFYIALVGFRLFRFWRSKSTTRPTSVGSWNQKPNTDQLKLRLELKLGRHQVGWLVFWAMFGSGHPYSTNLEIKSKKDFSMWDLVFFVFLVRVSFLETRNQKMRLLLGL